MRAYIIFIRRHLRSEDEFKQYNRLARKVSTEVAIKPLAFYGQVIALENIETDGVAILEFPTLKDAQDWYQSDAYQAAKKHRDLAGEYQVLITEGLNLTA